MRITINREDLMTKKQVINILKQNKTVKSNDFHRGWNECIKQMIEVFEKAK